MQGTAQLPAEHKVTFYAADSCLVEQVAAFVKDGLLAGERVIVIATIEHWNAISARLEDGAVAYGRAATEGRLVFIEAGPIVDTLTAEGGINVDTFRGMLEPLLRPGIRTRIYGELVSLLAQRGDLDGAIAIERIGHELAHTMSVPVLCGYALGGTRALRPADITRIEAAHDRTCREGEHRHAALEGSVSAQDCCHAVRFYESRDALARIVGQFLREGLVAGFPAVVIATPAHREAINNVLTESYLDVARLQESGDLIMADAEALLSKFMIAGMPERRRFEEAVVPLIEQACRGRSACVVRAYGEMVDVLWGGGQTAAAVRLETLWNLLARSHSFALLCGYSIGHFYRNSAQQEICELHTHVLGDTSTLARSH